MQGLTYVYKNPLVATQLKNYQATRNKLIIHGKSQRISMEKVKTEFNRNHIP